MIRRLRECLLLFLAAAGCMVCTASSASGSYSCTVLLLVRIRALRRLELSIFVRIFCLFQAPSRSCSLPRPCTCLLHFLCAPWSMLCLPAASAWTSHRLTLWMAAWWRGSTWRSGPSSADITCTGLPLLGGSCIIVP